jgi:hypothetical protein
VDNYVGTRLAGKSPATIEELTGSHRVNRRLHRRLTELALAVERLGLGRLGR